ncbi:hypothetical protein BN871_HE_00020 [Paenibacillus sp. P22]|nr:hypothetical protein BN871_HE_00020 [Paenibacillus sp. P22]
MNDSKVISFRGVTKQYDDDVPVLKDVSFDIERGKFYTLLGPSGCGKTTILRLIAGFMEPTSGEILMDGRSINSVPANKRQVNTVFQDYALFPHLNVYDNVAFGLRIRKLKGAEIERKVKEALRFVNLEGYDKREIREMSGGQRQRVAIARAIVNEPQVLLLDEPLGALDALTRIEMQSLIESLWAESGFTTILVTHDVSEAVALADRVLLIEEGRIALDISIELARPRERDSGFAYYENLILNKVLGRKEEPLPPAAQRKLSYSI